MKRLSALCACAALLLSLAPLASCASERGTSYEIEGEYFPEERMLSAYMTADVLNTSENVLSELKFQLFPNAYREGAKYSPVPKFYAEACYYNGLSYGGIEIGSVEGGTYEICGEDENILSVSLPEPLFPDERAAVRIEFSTRLPEINHRLGAGERAVNLANFYPALCPLSEEGFTELVYAEYGDPFVSACADYSVSLRVPENYEVFGAEREGERYVLREKGVRDVAFVIAEGYVCEERETDGVKVKYCRPAEKSSSVAMRAASESLSYFIKNFSPYPHASYWVVQTDFPYGGMEYPMLSMISLSLREEEIPRVVAHETAHQWWYSSVGSDQFNEAWQDEGLAEYSVALLAEENPFFGDYETLVRTSERAYRAFFSAKSQVSGGADTRMSRPLTEYSGPYEYRSIAYDKGVVLFDTLRTVAGKKKLMCALSLYARRFAGKIASRADMVASFSAAGVRAGELISSFADGKCVI